MITEKELEDLGLKSYVIGYYYLDNDLTIDVEGSVRIEVGDYTGFICELRSIEEVKLLIEWINR